MAISYAASVRLPGSDDPETIRWTDRGQICKKVAVEDAAADRDVSFYTSHPYSTTRPTHSCG